MGADLDRKALHCLIRTGDLVTLQSAGVTPDWLDDLQSKSALQAVLDYSSAPGTAGTVPGASYLVERMCMVPGTWDGHETMPQLVEALKVERHKKLLGLAIQRASSTNASNPVEAHNNLLQVLMGADLENLRAQGRDTTLGGLAKEMFRRYRESMSDAGITGVPTPFPSLTYATKGFQRGNLYCFFASEGSYKSWCALACAVEAWRQRPEQNVLVITSEMPAEECAVRVACLVNGWDFNAYRDRKLPVAQVMKWFSTDASKRFHFYQPTGTDDQAIAEVRAKIQKLNLIGGVSLVLWDGHYRSASTPEWQVVYHLVQRTRALALEEEILQPPILVVTQEGSTKGKSTNRIYAYESTLMLFLTKIAWGRVLAQSTKMREGPTLEIEIAVNLILAMVTEICARFDNDEAVGTGGLV